METGVRKTVRFRILQAGILLLLASSANSTGLIDRMHSIAEQAWEDEYIPDSGIPATPLTDYDNFEVTELFRAVTIEDLEAAITGGYPMAWLEETLKDETIPWEDRYWLDRRVRAAIAQNTHTFFNPAGSPVHIDADGIFPGELYWREHMIVDPAGWNIPEGLRRPTNLGSWDTGYLLNPYGYGIGEIALAIPTAVFISRDASVGVVVSGGNGWNHTNRQPYACFLSPDGSFSEVPLSNIGEYDVTLSANGNLVAFSFTEDHIRADQELIQYNADIELFTGAGNFIRAIDTPANLSHSRKRSITQDGRYLCHQTEAVNTCLIDCLTGQSILLSQPPLDRNTHEFRFSPDGNSLVLSGSTTERAVNLITDEQFTLPFRNLFDESSGYSSCACCSNDLFMISSVRRSFLSLLVNNEIVFSEQILSDISNARVRYPVEADISPNTHFLFINPRDAATGAPSPFVGAPPGAYNLPLVVMKISGR